MADVLFRGLPRWYFRAFLTASVLLVLFNLVSPLVLRKHRRWTHGKGISIAPEAVEFGNA